MKNLNVWIAIAGLIFSSAAPVKAENLRFNTLSGLKIGCFRSTNTCYSEKGTEDPSGGRVTLFFMFEHGEQRLEEIDADQFATYLEEKGYPRDSQESDYIPNGIKQIQEGCGSNFCFVKLIGKNITKVHILYVSKNQMMHCIVDEKDYESFLKKNDLK